LNALLRGELKGGLKKWGTFRGLLPPTELWESKADRLEK